MSDADETLDVYQRQGLGARMGFGKKPALVIVDFINGFNDPDAFGGCLLYTSPSPRDRQKSRMPSSA